MAAVVTAAQFEAATLHDKYNVLQIVQHLQKVAPRQPVIGVICGSGLSELHEILTDRVTLPYATIPGFPQSTVQGQVGELVFGFLDGKSVVLMRGRFHFYEGYDPKLVSLPVRVFAALGVRALVVTNASGGVNPVYNIGDFMILQDHMSFPGLSGVSPLIGENDVRFGPRFPAIGPVYSPVLQNIAFKKAEELGLSARMRLGTYVGVAGAVDGWGWCCHRVISWWSFCTIRSHVRNAA
jgi:purine-nucleoside phosphorylase